MSDNRKDIEIINDNGSTIEISDVYDHLNSGKPKCNEDKPKNIVIPEEHKNKRKNKKIDNTSD